MTNDFKKWLNKKESSKEIVTDSLIQKYKACLSADVDVKNLLGLHWCLTQPKETRLNLNIDGHIKKGNFMPPIPLEQRMWAASSISFFEDLSSVNEIERFSEIKKIERKISKNSGELYFVEIEHNYYSEKILLIRETQSLVYKEFSSIKIKKNGKRVPINEFLYLECLVLEKQCYQTCYNQHLVGFITLLITESELDILTSILLIILNKRL